MLWAKNFLSLISSYINRIFNIILFILLLVMTVATFAQVFCRYVLNFSIPWSEELSRFLFTWIVFAGVPCLIYSSGMTAFNLFLMKLSGWKARFISCVITAGYLVFFFLLTKGSLILVERQLMQTATSIPVSMGLIYGVIPVSGVLAIIVTLERFLDTWTKTAEGR